MKTATGLMISLMTFVVIVGGILVLADDEKPEATLTPERDIEAKIQKMCPVMGGQINKSIFADHDGKRIFFCCPPCKDEFIKNPDQYLKAMEADGIILAKASSTKQTTCPITEKTIDKSVFVEHGGKRIYFCSAGCIEKFNLKPEDYL